MSLDKLLTELLNAQRSKASLRTEVQEFMTQLQERLKHSSIEFTQLTEIAPLFPSGRYGIRWAKPAGITIWDRQEAKPSNLNTLPEDAIFFISTLLPQLVVMIEREVVQKLTLERILLLQARESLDLARSLVQSLPQTKEDPEEGAPGAGRFGLIG